MHSLLDMKNLANAVLSVDPRSPVWREAESIRGFNPCTNCGAALSNSCVIFNYRDQVHGKIETLCRVWRKGKLEGCGPQFLAEHTEQIDPMKPDSFPFPFEVFLSVEVAKVSDLERAGADIGISGLAGKYVPVSAESVEFFADQEFLQRFIQVFGDKVDSKYLR